MFNQTPGDWYTKKQNTVETSTFGSEFVAARIVAEQNIDPRLTFRCMGVVVGRSIMFGDNESVVKNSTIPHSRLMKRHMALSHHRVREAIASNVLSFFHMPGKENPSDVLSEHWGHQQIWQVLRPLPFWEGDTMDCAEAKSVQNKGE